MSKYLFEIRKIQQEYCDLLVSFNPNADDETYYYQAVALIDKCELFWMSKRLEVLEILSDLAASEQCFLLCGASCLELDDGCHYEMGAFGDRQIINDPVVSMKHCFCDISAVASSLKEWFSHVISDTIAVLCNYSNSFFVVSIDSLLYADADENYKITEKVYWDIISESLCNEIRSREELISKYATIGQLEEALGDRAKHFVFDESLDYQLPLSNRVKEWFDSNSQIVEIGLFNEVDQFFLASFSFIRQALEILLKCCRLNVYPFIRHPVTLHYFIHVAGGVSKDITVSNLIEYAILSYLFANFIVPNKLDTVDFSEYQKLCKEQNLVERFKQAVFADNISYSNLKIDKAREAMAELFQKEIMDKVFEVDKD